MQQGMKKMPERRGSITEQAIADLKSADPLIARNEDAIAKNWAIFRNPESIGAKTGPDSNKVRAEILEDVIAMAEGNIKRIENARGLPGIAINERNPEYKEAVDEVIKGYKDGLAELKKARLELLGAYKKA